MEFLVTILYHMFMFAYSLYPEPKLEPEPCKGEIVQTRMGEICIWSKEPEFLEYIYMGAYISHLYEKFDPTVVPYSGQKYSNKRLYCIYRYTIHRDGSIHDLKIEVPQNEQFDAYVKKIILDNPPAPLFEGMPDSMKVELAMNQNTRGMGTGLVGRRWHDYYIMDIRKCSKLNK